MRVLDPHGRVAEAALPAPEPHWVAVPSMDALPRRWAQPLAATGSLELETRVTRIERDALNPHLLAIADQRAAGLGPCLFGLRRRRCWPSRMPWPAGC